MSFSKANQEPLIDDGLFNWKTGQFQAPTSSTGAVVVFPDFHLSLGWLTMSFTLQSGSDLSSYVDLISSCYICHLDDVIIDTSLSFRGYKQSIKFASGATIAYTLGRNDFIFVMPQSAIESINTPYFLLLLNDLLSVPGAKVTRFDLTVDDFQKLLAISEIYQSCQTGCMVARTKTFGYSVEFSSPGILSKEILTIGKRVSNFYVRVYDKFLESKGKIDSIRFEVELKGKLAHCFVFQLLSSSFNFTDRGNPVQDFSVAGFARSVLGLIKSKLDFRDPESHSNIYRRSVLPFWDAFLHQVEKIKVIIPRKKVSLESSKVWVESKVATVLAMLSIYLGSDTDLFISNLLSSGRSRLRNRHFAMLRDACT